MYSLTCLNTEYLKHNKQPITHPIFVIQEQPKSLCFRFGFNSQDTQPLSEKVAFEPEKLKAAK
ncbi:hypothetical protein CGI68_24545 [Vibrio parahaemolyticus]|nr:hypothetical protein CGI68_24545 [Vibrio parahaemolyticus]